MTARFRCAGILFFIFGSFFAQATIAKEAAKHWLRQIVYVPVYSHIYGEDRYRDKPFLLTATLSIRNADQQNPMTLKRVEYYDSDGNLLKVYITDPVNIAPFHSAYYIVQESETKGGTGAKFVVEWDSKKAIIEPIIESVMIGTKMQQGISFLSPGRLLQGTTAE